MCRNVSLARPAAESRHAGHYVLLLFLLLHLFSTIPVRLIISKYLPNRSSPIVWVIHMVPIRPTEQSEISFFSIK